MSSEAQVKSVWKHTDAVCFDVDSTVIQEEGLDELAKFCGKGEEVTTLTKEAMKGSLTFRDAFAKRLSIIKPHLNQMRNFIQIKPSTLTPGIKQLIISLQQRNIPVYFISGGLRGLITPVALELNIPLENIYANKLKFYFNGEYAGFDESEPTSRSGGKAEVIKLLKEKHGYINLVIIGDGATDAEACPPADAFIGFGGNIVRQEVKERAKWFVTNFQELMDAL